MLKSADLGGPGSNILKSYEPFNKHEAGVETQQQVRGEKKEKTSQTAFEENRSIVLIYFGLEVFNFRGTKARRISARLGTMVEDHFWTILIIRWNVASRAVPLWWRGTTCIG